MTIRNGLTISMVFAAESANYGEGFGNVAVLKKMTRGDAYQYSMISRQAMRYNMMNQLGWDVTPVDGKSGVVQFAPEATIRDYPEIDLFGYMKTKSKKDAKEEKDEKDAKGGAMTRSAVVRLSNAISLEPFAGDMDFLTNMGLARRNNLENGIAQSEVHASYYGYTVSIDLDLVGIDGEVQIPDAEKAERVKGLLTTIEYLYRDIKGRRENLAPVFVIGGRYSRKNPFFENRIKLSGNAIHTELLRDVMTGNQEILDNTIVGVLNGIFNNTDEIKEKLGAATVSEAFQRLRKEVSDFYG